MLVLHWTQIKLHVILSQPYIRSNLYKKLYRIIYSLIIVCHVYKENVLFLKVKKGIYIYERSVDLFLLWTHLYRCLSSSLKKKKKKKKKKKYKNNILCNDFFLLWLDGMLDMELLASSCLLFLFHACLYIWMAGQCKRTLWSQVRSLTRFAYFKYKTSWYPPIFGAWRAFKNLSAITILSLSLSFVFWKKLSSIAQYLVSKK
jgi:hypothetical protein